ncbi:MAG TPA: hypothetical protein VLA82_02360 [Actinomycetota bacterium]|nr:hypothetical protein [Actinomycetota bacterium]
MPADAEELDLTRVGGSTVDDGPFLLGGAPRGTSFSPLWDMDVVVGQGITDPVVLGTSAVVLYLGSTRFDSDGLTKFDTNEIRFRLEAPCLLVVRQANGVYVVAGS